MTEGLNNRELAVLLWIVVVLGWALTKAELRKSLLGLIRAALAWKLALSFGLMVAYTILMVLALRALRLWDTSNLKPTILWALTTPPVMILDVTSIPEDAQGLSDNN